MGWKITHNEQGYQIISSITDQVIHEKERLTEEETKALMAEIALYEFYEKLIKIDKDFLFGYSINGKRNLEGDRVANQWMYDNENQIPVEGQKILKRLLEIIIDEK